MKKRKKVAVLFLSDWPGAPAVMSAVMDYARAHGDWRILPLPRGFSGDIDDLWSFEADGAVAGVNSKREAALIRRRRMPVVGLGRTGLPEGLVHRVMEDDEATGRMSATHFLDRGFRRLAFVGLDERWAIRRRHQGFVKAAEASGVSVVTFEMPMHLGSWTEWNVMLARLERWLCELAHPVGIMASEDQTARVVLEAGHAAGLHVPDDVAILGVGNDESLCKYCEPQLSSVVLPEYDVGYRAAALLDRLMAGRKAPVRDVLLPPEGVVLRGSTDVLAVENPHMRAVVEYIRTHDGDVFGVERLMEQVPLSRRSLELKFHEALGCTLYQYLCKIRVDKAKNLLLARADAKLRDVAAACGFSCNKRFRIVFRRLTGRRPAEYRREHLRSRAQ